MALCMEALEDEHTKLKRQFATLQQENLALSDHITKKGNFDDEKFKKIAHWMEIEAVRSKAIATSIKDIGDIVKGLDERMTAIEISTHVVKGV